MDNTKNCLRCGGVMIFDDVCFEDDGAIVGIYKCEIRCDLEFLHESEELDTPPKPLKKDEWEKFDLPF